MVSLKLLKNPGYIYDLCFVFYLKFNYKTYISSLPKQLQQNKKVASFDAVLHTFGDIPDDLFVFFHANESGLTFVPSKCIWPHENLFTTSFDFEFFHKQFFNNEDITRKVLEFYFNDLTEEETAACMNSTAEVHQKIKASNYSAEEKAKLYEFFFQPNFYIELLRNQLTEKEKLLATYYEKNYSRIFDVFNATTFDILSKQVKELKDLSFLNESGQVLYTSYCLLHKYFIQLFCAHDNAVYLLGHSYQDILEFAKKKNPKDLLEHVGHSPWGREPRLDPEVSSEARRGLLQGFGKRTRIRNNRRIPSSNQDGQSGHLENPKHRKIDPIQHQPPVL